MEQKAIFLDLDGTLLDDAKHISQGNRQTIARALEKGHKVIICTGRPLCSAIAQAETLGLTEEGCYVIGFNGCVHYDMGKRQILYRDTLPLDVVYRIFEEANARNLHVQTYEDDRVILEPQGDDALLAMYMGKVKIDKRVVDDIHTLKTQPEKCLVMTDTGRQTLLAFRDHLKAMAGDKLDGFLSSDFLLEIVPYGLNKGTALKRMAALLNIPVENTIAVGDAENDIAMIQQAGLGVCMINGDKDIQAMAGYVTERDNNHDGVAEVIEKFML